MSVRGDREEETHYIGVCIKNSGNTTSKNKTCQELRCNMIHHFGLQHLEGKYSADFLVNIQLCNFYLLQHMFNLPKACVKTQQRLQQFPNIDSPYHPLLLDM